MTLGYQAKGESQYFLTQREPTEKEKRDYSNLLALHYSILPGVEKVEPLPFLELLPGRLTGALAARVTHTLRLAHAEEGRPAAWRLTTTIEAPPTQTDIDSLLLDLPPDFQLDETAGALAAGDAQVGRTGPDRQTQLVLTPKHKARDKPFKLTVEGQYDPRVVPAAEDGGHAAVSLPTLLSKKYDRGAVVTVALPQDLEPVPPRAGPLWDEGKPEGHNKRTWTFERWPERFEMAWQPYRPRLVVHGEARVWLLGRQASVTHRFWLPPGQAVPEQLLLGVPRELIGFTVAGEAEGAPRREGKDGTRAAALAAPADRDHPLVVKYSFLLPERAADPVKVPLAWAARATGGETRVCVWSDPGTRLEYKEGPWEVRRTEEIKDEKSYPALVLSSDRPGAPLALAQGDAAGAALAAFRVERVLIQATVLDSGQQRYRARFRLGQVAAPTIDVVLPPTAQFRPNPPDVTVLFGGKGASWWPVDAAGKETGVSQAARVKVPADAAGKSVILEINYTLLPGRSVLLTQLQAPELRGDPGAAPVRWQVVLPPSWVPLSQDTTGAEYGWGRRGWLYALRPTVSTADFESWFAGSGAVPDASPYADPSVAVWRSSPEPLRLNHVPEQPWLLVCSLTLLIVGLSLAFLSLPRAVFWVTLSALGVGALLAGLFWPGVLGAILYGCQPGAMVLLPVLAVQWLVRQRYRRQVVFLPGFTRLKAGSSLVRGSNRPRGEPSTVDATPSSQRPATPEPPNAGQ
jgi:hypothetical protein